MLLGQVPQRDLPGLAGRELDGEPLYLDPFDRSVGPGHIGYRYEGTKALIFDTASPEIIRLPSSSFAHYRDESVLTPSWPPGWELEAPPGDMAYAGTAGQITCRLEADESRRELTFRRLFELAARELTTRDSYAALRDLYQRAFEADAQSLVLVHKYHDSVGDDTAFH